MMIPDIAYMHKTLSNKNANLDENCKKKSIKVSLFHNQLYSRSWEDY